MHFHRTWKSACDRHDAGFYPRFKKWCDEYFYLPHRGETRGVGGIFFDYLQRDSERDFAFVRDVGDAFLDAYLPIVRRRRRDGLGRARATVPAAAARPLRRVQPALRSRHRCSASRPTAATESILMSLPPLVRWEYDSRWEPGSREAELPDWLKPRDWLGGG